MRALERKLLRDLWKAKGQGLAISLVIAAGVAMFIMYLSTFQSLRLTQETYYERFRFADVFARLKRAPRWLEQRIAEIPGVAQVDTRVVVDVTLDVSGLSEPATGRLISIPARRTAMLNDIFIRRGRYIEPDRPDEVLVSEVFAEARGLTIGDTVTALVNGRRRHLEIVGMALSPEYVYSVRPGELIPDTGRFGIFWMERRALAAAFDLEGSFNDVVLQLMPGAVTDDVITRLDRLLARYGGLGAIPRALQLSHWTLDNELAQLQGVGLFVPMIFFAVTAFLLNIVLTRTVAVQREQIAALKALGYANLEIGRHYAQWGLAIALAGVVLGVACGAWLGMSMIGIYNQYFRFPELLYVLPPGVVVGAAGISLTAALLGAAGAVRRAVRLPPAEAMRPEPPARYRESWIERLGLKSFFSPPSRMILRNLQRQPVRAGTTVIGIAFAAAMLVVGLFGLDAMAVMLDVQFNVVERQDVTVSFVEPVSAAAFFEVKRLPGVLAVERQRSVPARLRYGHRSRNVAIIGLAADARLIRVIDTSLEPVLLPPEGLVLSTKLAELLGARRGDVLTVEILEGKRPTRQVVVADLVEEYMGTSVYMELDALHRLLHEGGNLSTVTLAVDSAESEELYRRLKAIPAVAGVAVKDAALESFQETLAKNLGVLIFFNVLFAGIIAFGVVYNAARISLSERSRELASLRVIGFRRSEISFILLGELVVLALVAIPLGLLLGYGLAALVVGAFNTELYRFPLVVAPRTYAFSALTVAVATAVSGLVVRRRLDRLDLVEVLKTRE